MMHLHGKVATPLATQYLLRLCRHFSKKVEVDYDPEDGRQGYARFPFGECQLAADEVELSFSCATTDAESLLRMQSVIELHVGMFSRRQPLQVVWSE